MKRYDEYILSQLLDKYENSLLYEGKNQKNVTISFPVTKTTLPDYYDETSLKADAVHDQLLQLSEEGLVTLRWDKNRPGHILTSCVLTVENVGKAYDFLGRTGKREKIARAEALCKELLSVESYADTGVLRNFISYLKEQLSAGRFPKQYLEPENTERLRDTVGLVYAILTNESSCYLREFSVKVFRDSKVFEKELSGACAVIRRFSDTEEFNDLTDEELLSEFGIMKNPSHIFMKGSGDFRIGESRICLSSFPEGIAVSGNDAEKIMWDKNPQITKMVTIENLTSFYRWNPEQGEVSIYLGGYHNRSKREFIQKLHAAFPQAEPFHFGDIDCGGFRIWKDLCIKTGIGFQTLHMDPATYIAYSSFGKSLSENDRKTLKLMAEDPYFKEQIPLFQQMLLTGIKLEQEAIVR